MTLSTEPLSMFRYMDRVYVDAFFRSGELRLPTYGTFSRHSEEAYRDEAEGHSIFTLQGTETTTMGALDFSSHAYVLCGSNLSPTNGGARFGRTGCIQIVDIEKFAECVQLKIEECSGWRAGDCDYLDDAVLLHLDVGPEVDMQASAIRNNHPEGFKSSAALEVNKLIGREDVCAPSSPSAIKEVADLLARVGANFEEVFYRKRLQYSSDLERRIVWLGSGSPFLDRIVIVPNARQYCRDVSNQLA